MVLLEARVLLPDGRIPFSFSKPPSQLTGAPHLAQSTRWGTHETECHLTS